jgi:type IV pilus assembly protein PilO
MLDKIKNLKWYFQLMLLVTVGALLYTSVWYMYTADIRTETATVMEQVGQLQAKNEAARVATQRINEFRALYASKSEEYEELKVLLPEQREITNVLESLQNTANGQRLTVMRFNPREDKQQDGIMAKEVEVEVDSNFNNLRAFFDSMAKLPRIVSITDFKIHQLPKQSDAKTIHSSFVLTAYYASPENLTPKPAGVPGAPPAPGQPAPAAGQPAAPAGAPAGPRPPAVQTAVPAAAPAK